MNPKTKNPNPPTPQLTDAQLCAAFCADQDSILPSSGFAEAVMTAVRAEAAAPAPIPFPWKRAVPGIAAGMAALGFLIAFVARLPFSPTSVAARFGWATTWRGPLAALLHPAAGADGVWLMVSLAIPLLCLLVMRRVLFSR
jgi:hypothetical protein